MDELDIRIVRELSQGRNVGFAWGGINPAYRAIGLRVGASKDAVRERIRRMEGSGFLKEFPVQVNPNLLGLTMGAITVEPSKTMSRDLAEALPLVEGVLLYVAHVSGVVGIIFFYKDERSRNKKVELISKISHASWSQFSEIPYPPCSIELSRVDWEVVAALQESKRAPIEKIAQGLGVSPKTVQRRLKRLIDGWAVSTIISMDVRRLRGAVTANLIIEYSRGSDRQRTDRSLMAELERFLFFPGLWSDFSVYSLILPSIPSAEQVLESASKTDGVKVARVELVADRIETYEVLREQVQEKLAGGG